MGAFKRRDGTSRKGLGQPIGGLAAVCSKSGFPRSRDGRCGGTCLPCGPNALTLQKQLFAPCGSKRWMRRLPL